MLRILLSLAVLLGIGGRMPLAAEEFDQKAILSAARAADDTYRRHFSALVLRLRDPAEKTRIATIGHLARLQDPMAISHLQPFLEAASHTSAEVIAACLALEHLNAVGSSDALKRLLTHADANVRLAAMNALNQLNRAGTAEWLDRAKKDDDASQRLGAITDLGATAAAEAGETLVKALAKDPRLLVRRSAAIGLGQLGDRTYGPALVDALCDADAGVRRYAAEALVKVDYKPAIPHLLIALEANIAGDHLRRCLKLLCGNDFGFDPRADLVKRIEAIDRGFAWWNEHTKEFAAAPK